MPDFANPGCLLFLLVLPPLVWWWLHPYRGALRFPAIGSAAGLPRGRSRLARWGSVGLRTAAFVLLILGLAGLRWPDRGSRIPTEGIAIEMVVDVSGTMAEPDFRWGDSSISRLDAVKRVFRLFVAGGESPGGQPLAGRPTDLIGLVAFATRPESPCPLTLSHSALLEILDRQDIAPKGERTTNISDAIVLALHRLDCAGARRKVMVLLTDGEHNVPDTQSGWTPRQAAQVAANLGVPIYTIDVGKESDTEADAASAAEAAARRIQAVQSLQQMAQVTRGAYFQAQDTQALLEVYRQIDRLERKEIESFQYRRYYEAFPWLGLAAFALLVGGCALEMTLWRRVP